MFVCTLHTLKSQAGAAEEGGDPVLGASEVALGVVVDGMGCVCVMCQCLNSQMGLDQFAACVRPHETHRPRLQLAA